MTTITETITANVDFINAIAAKGAKVTFTPARVNNRGRELAARYLVDISFIAICGEITDGITSDDFAPNYQTGVVDFRDNGKGIATVRFHRLDDERGEEYESAIRAILAC